MAERFGIVYMGSKEKVLHLIRYIFEREYKKEYLIDLFCGGFSVSNYALLKTNFKVIANDANKYVISLYEELISGGKNFETIKYQWVSRERFCDVRDNPDFYPDWYVGYVLNIWSFGCNQKDYLYAKDLEENKHALHQAIVYNDFSLIESNELFNGFVLEESILRQDYKTNMAKRTNFMSSFKKFIHSVKDERSSNLERLERYTNLERLEQMENLNQLEHTLSIKKACHGKSRLSLYKDDYLKTLSIIPKHILDKAFIYADPPYEDTKKYMFGTDFDYVQFWDWFRNAPYSIYVSSYKAPDDIKPLNFDFKQVNLDNGNRNNERRVEKKKAIENIYWNGKGNAEPTMLDLLFNPEKCDLDEQNEN